MKPERMNYQAVLESLADGAEVDWAALETFAATPASAAAITTCGSWPVSRSCIARWAPRKTQPEAGPAGPDGHPSPCPAPGDTSTCRSGLPEARSATSILPETRTSIAMSRSSCSVSTPRQDCRSACSTRRARSRASGIPTSSPSTAPTFATVGPGCGWSSCTAGRSSLAAGQRRDRSRRSRPCEVDLCRALAAVHGAGLLHGDVKAQNVMREAGGRIVLMDFGAGRAQGARSSGSPARRSTSRRKCLPASPRRRGAISKPRRPAVSHADARVSVFRGGSRRAARGARRRLARDVARPSSGPARRARAGRPARARTGSRAAVRDRRRDGAGPGASAAAEAGPHALGLARRGIIDRCGGHRARQRHPAVAHGCSHPCPIRSPSGPSWLPAACPISSIWSRGSRPTSCARCSDSTWK